MYLVAAQSSKPIQLLSCNDLGAALKVSEKAKTPFYASDGWVKVNTEGDVASKNPFYKFANGERTDESLAHVTEVEGEVVRLGGGSSLDDIVNALKTESPSTWRFNKVGGDAFEIIDGVGTKWGTIFKDRIVAPGRTAIGTPGNPIINKTTLVKDIKYDVDGIIYQTDDLGRVVKTNADLDDIARVRLGNQQIKAADVKDGVRGTDQGGHIVGSRFFGPGEQINLYPQSANLNQGAWKNMENGWADAMVQGKDVKIEVEAIFTGASKRPDEFVVKYTIDGQPFKESFKNQ